MSGASRREIRQRRQEGERERERRRPLGAAHAALYISLVAQSRTQARRAAAAVDTACTSVVLLHHHLSARRGWWWQRSHGRREMGRDGTSTRRDVPVPCMFRTVRNGFVDSDTRSARHRMCATARAYVCRASFQTTRRGDRLSHSPALSGARVLPPQGGRRRAPKGGGEVSRSSANVQLSLVRRHIVRYYRVSCRRHESTSVRPVRRGERVRRSVRRLCLGCLERQRRTVESRAGTSAAGASSLWVRKRPSARRGPGIVSVDRNVRSKCRCSCVLQFTR